MLKLVSLFLFMTLLSCAPQLGLEREPASTSSKVRPINLDPMCSDEPISCSGGITYLDGNGDCRQFCPELVTGYNNKGELTSCYDVTASGALVCDASMRDGDFFGIHCQEMGGDVVSCGCHSNLCSIDISEGGTKQFGMDKDGNYKGCVPSTTITYCQGNTHSDQCLLSGYEVVACDCENLLCTIK